MIDTDRQEGALLFFAFSIKRTHDALFTVYKNGLEWEKELAINYLPEIIEIAKKAQIDISTGTIAPDIEVNSELVELRTQYTRLQFRLNTQILKHYEQAGTSIYNDTIAKKDNISYKSISDFLKSTNEARARLPKEEVDRQLSDSKYYFERLYNYTTAANLDFVLVNDLYHYVVIIDDIYTFQTIAASAHLKKSEDDDTTILDFIECDFVTAFKDMLPGMIEKLQEVQKAAEENKELEQQALPVINDFLAKKIQYTHTKIDRHLFNLLEEAEDGQYNFAVDVSNINDKRKGVEVFINYMLDFSEIE